jgi:hypothetical protein
MIYLFDFSKLATVQGNDLIYVFSVAISFLNRSCARRILLRLRARCLSFMKAMVPMPVTVTATPTISNSFLGG